MNFNEIYERWRHHRSQVNPSASFTDRVMDSLGNQDPKTEPRVEGRRVGGFVRAGACAAAAVAAVFRVVELLNLFVASRLDN